VKLQSHHIGALTNKAFLLRVYMNTNEPILVTIDKDMQDLVPLFIKQREADITSLTNAIAASDHETMRRIGHSLAGAGASYGFQRVSEIGAALEAAAKLRDDAEIAKASDVLKDYMRRLVVKYV
jgi:HPt (histidine-containing phosphotransfer) domain-containing protein